MYTYLVTISLSDVLCADQILLTLHCYDLEGLTEESSFLYLTMRVAPIFCGYTREGLYSALNVILFPLFLTSSMSVERDIRFDLIARLCPNTTGAELRSVATEVRSLVILLNPYFTSNRLACSPSVPDERSLLSETFWMLWRKWSGKVPSSLARRFTSFSPLSIVLTRFVDLYIKSTIRILYFVYVLDYHSFLLGSVLSSRAQAPAKMIPVWQF